MINATFTSNTNTSSLYDNARALNIIVPDEFICPITLDIMIEPMMSRTGFNFERHAIVDWISNGPRTCPMSRKPLVGRCVIARNRALQDKIWMWLWENCIFPLSLEGKHGRNMDDTIVLEQYGIIPKKMTEKRYPLERQYDSRVKSDELCEF
jgi:U-box domain